MASNIKPCVDHPSFVSHWAPNPSTERGDNLVLGTHPKESKIIYPSGKFIVVRDVKDPTDVFVYRGHNSKTTVAKFSPNGFWVASADITGKVRIWAWDNPEHQLKIEVFGLGGAIKDLAWGPESKRIVCCGAGSGVNARAFMWDTGSNLGEVVGHSKRVISCDYRQVRPYRIMTGSEDHRTIFYQGPPFKMDHSNNNQHTNFVNCVRFSPDGSKIATCSSDKKVWLYDGKTGEPLSTLGEAAGAHAGSIYSLAWSPDSSSVATASADKTVRLFDAASGACTHTWSISDSPGVGDMQVAVAFCGEQLVSVSLNGNVNMLDAGSERPRDVYQAHQGAITAMTRSPVSAGGGAAAGKILTGSFTGVLCAWDPATGGAKRCTGGKAAPVTGAVHSNKITGIAACSAGVVSVGWDDTLRLAPLDGESGSGGGPVFTASVGTTGQPCGVAANADSDLVAVATNQGVTLLRGTTPAVGLSATYTPSSIAMAPGAGEIAVGSKEGKIYVYETAGDELRETKVVDGHRGEVTCVAYSPDGTLLAAGDAAREVTVWRAGGDWDAEVRGLWQFHTARVACLAWSPEGTYLASGGLDENVFVWNPAKPRRRVHYTFANKDGVEGLAWLSDGVVASAGGDHCVATWDITKDISVFDT
ncbi:WD66_PHYPO66 kDa stress protein (p66) [Ectocarpus siliculosus]|uniref:WD66_PHYPO66 kDa stress protein (p66) n=1 Tax=Ectocarpus siliculosus TaxID=2880 RepID=D8LFK5_ECTSI|nr:WD66_PHYPO66 kDa stress protein (p66) [Ectocarpus siliculosus]|eukprot:CBN79925.1 WD66_PHYPO66 kDa stress protein (p66) [Ectocarpus siliculosus]